MSAPCEQFLPWLLPRFLGGVYFLAFASLLVQLPAVHALFRHIPFQGAPPVYIMLTVYRYQFSGRPSLPSEGRWWERSRVGRFPLMTLQKGELVASKD
jgi:hypothetical protein